MKVKIPENLADFIDTLIERGYYGSKSEVITEGVKILAERWKCGYCSAYTLNFIKEILSMCNVKQVQYECPRHGKISINVPTIRRILVPKELASLGIKCNLCGELCCDYTGESYGDIYTKTLLGNIPNPLLKKTDLHKISLILDGKFREAYILLVEDKPCPFLKQNLCSFYFENAQDKRHPLCISSPFRLVIRGQDFLWTFVRPHKKCQVELVDSNGEHLKKSLDAWSNWAKVIAEDLGLNFNNPPISLINSQNCYMCPT
ncbi:MAG: type II toxin-antitoxin system ParD family antitoxin [archaeon]|nr:type II toxin-antitoxin system ParD family antitoxin [archaeon]